MSQIEEVDESVVQLAAFKVGSEEYVVDIMRVREIIRPIPVTRVRKGPKFVEGVINLRGEVIPIIDLRRRFELPVDQNTLSKIVILKVDVRVVGLVVDSVTEVVRVPKSAIRRAPEVFETDDEPYFLGVCQFRSRTLLLLNVKSVIASDEPIDLTHAQDLARTQP